MPWTTIELALRLSILILEGIPAEQRQAQAIAWFWLWWPVLKLGLSDSQERQILAVMEKIGRAPEAQAPAAAPITPLRPVTA